uniref:PNPLA domain-containing protein n=1 Tax=Macrostomum lignano TaxID=282301 RepID=A0A1I8FKL2_9PLAT
TIFDDDGTSKPSAIDTISTSIALQPVWHPRPTRPHPPAVGQKQSASARRHRQVRSCLPANEFSATNSSQDFLLPESAARISHSPRCGFMGVYHVACAAVLKEYAPQLYTNRVLAGASAGALAACCLMCDCDLAIANVQRAHTGLLRPDIPRTERCPPDGRLLLLQFAPAKLANCASEPFAGLADISPEDEVWFMMPQPSSIDMDITLANWRRLVRVLWPPGPDRLGADLSARLRRLR